MDLDNDNHLPLLALLSENKMRSHIINCIAALRIVQIQRMEYESEDIEKHEVVKRKVFDAACSMMINYTETDSRQKVINRILSAFPDNRKMSDWLPMHCAIALFVEDKISEEDVRILYTADPSALHQFSRDARPSRSERDGDECEEVGYTPVHLLCMQKKPKLSLIRYFSLRDPKAFLLCDKYGRSPLHFVASYSESLGLLQTVLQVDQTMTKEDSVNCYDDKQFKPLGLLCERCDFPIFFEMLSCLIEVDSTIEVIYNGIIRCIESSFTQSNRKRSDNDIRPGSIGGRILISLGILLKANPDAVRYRESSIFHKASRCLRGELGVAVLSLFHSKDSSGIKSFWQGSLPIHYAASRSSLDVLKFLYMAYPESLTMSTSDVVQNTLLHQTVTCFSGDMEVKIRYLLDQCPTMIDMVNGSSYTPLHTACNKLSRRFKILIILLNANPALARVKCVTSDTNHSNSQQLPLHLLINNISFNLYRPNSHNGDCFRLLLHLYPGSAGVKDSHSKSPYDLVLEPKYFKVDVYFIRLLLNDDPTIDLPKWRDLNYAARKEGMFLAFRALSTNLEPIIWSKIRYEDKVLLARVMSYL
jgi:uncharacterized cysteine cluster protein YcgN (CxxCxxCC family)